MNITVNGEARIVDEQEEEKGKTGDQRGASGAKLRLRDQSRKYCLNSGCGSIGSFR